MWSCSTYRFPGVALHTAVLSSLPGDRHTERLLGEWALGSPADGSHQEMEQSSRLPEFSVLVLGFEGFLIF
jgi:hypothetical protein